MALEVVLGSIVDGIGEPELAVQRAIGTGDGTAAVKTAGFVEHHFLSLAFSDVLWRGTGETGLFFGAVTSLLRPIGVDLEDIGGPRDHRNTTVAFFAVVFRGQNDVASQSSMALAPGWNGIEQDRKCVVSDFSAGEALTGKLSLKFKGEIASR